MYVHLRLETPRVCLESIQYKYAATLFSVGRCLITCDPPSYHGTSSPTTVFDTTFTCIPSNAVGAKEAHKFAHCLVDVK